ncbi:MAG: hypothetical protein ACRDLF_13335 [Solirubrobacteraceae bacterium]
MSSIPLTTPVAAGLPVTSEVNAPASVRDGSAAVKQAYASAQSFEEMLLQQLSQSLTQSSGLTGEGEAGGEGSGEEGSSAGGAAGGGMLASLLPQSLTEGVMREGGLGLATQLMGALDRSATATAAGRPAISGSMGGVSAPGSSTGVAGGAVGHTGGASA